MNKEEETIKLLEDIKQKNFNWCCDCDTCKDIKSKIEQKLSKLKGEKEKCQT